MLLLGREADQEPLGLLSAGPGLSDGAVADDALGRATPEDPLPKFSREIVKFLADDAIQCTQIIALTALDRGEELIDIGTCSLHGWHYRASARSGLVSARCIHEPSDADHIEC